jgi:hypothetical protein
MATQFGGSSAQARPLGLAVLLQTWTYPAATSRDLRLDFLRGFCLFAMIVDHIAGPSWLRWLTGGNSFYVSAAEGFVFISGLLVGTVYRNVIAWEGFRAAALKASRRACTLYVLMSVLTLLISYGGLAAGMWWVKPESVASPWAVLLNIFTLQYPFFMTDILVLYSLLMLGAPVALWLIQRGCTWLLLASSWALWLAYQLVPQIASQPFPTLQLFHPAAWQILFVHAIALGYHRARVALLVGMPRHRAIFAVSGVLLIALLIIYNTGGAVLSPLLGADVTPWLQDITYKNSMGVGRIAAAAVVFPFAYFLATYLWKPLRRLTGWLFLPLGQNSLYSYTMHLPLIIVSGLLLPDSPGVTLRQWLLNVTIQLGAVLAIWELVRRRVLFSVIPR